MKHLTKFYLFLSSIIIFTACKEQAAPPPNILICVADDISYPHIGINGCNWVKTPAIDRIANEGILFSQAYTPNSKCAPSRATILTGRYSWQLEEAGNHWCFFPQKFKTYAEVLNENGYYVGFTGKGWAPGDPGKDTNGNRRKLLGRRYDSLITKPPTKHISRNNYSGNFRHFLSKKPAGKPFCFWYGSNEPHRAYEFQSGRNVAGKNLEDIDKVPEFWPDVDSVRDDMLDYALEIEYFDKHLGEILAILEEVGELENTMILFTADNGMPFPRVKGQCYEFANHLPMAVMWKNGIKNPGRKVTDYVSFIDLAPTILNLAGVNGETNGMQPISGRSLTPYFAQNTRSDKYEHILVCKERHDIGRPHDWGYPIRGILQGDYLYLHNFENSRWPAGNPSTGYLNSDGGAVKSVLINGRKNPEIRDYWKLNFGFRPSNELYNITTDPYCINNLALDSANANMVNNLKSKLFEELIKEEDPRMFGNGHLFDEYPLANEKFRNFYEKFQKNEHPEPKWIFKSDFDAAAEKEEENFYLKN